jgi:hypothetical protein
VNTPRAPCLSCGRPTPRRISSLAAHARGSLEILLDEIGWTWDAALSAAIDRLVELEAAGR